MDIGKSKRKKIKRGFNKLHTKLNSIRLNDSKLGIIPHNQILWYISTIIDNVIEVVTPQDRDDEFDYYPGE